MATQAVNFPENPTLSDVFTDQYGVIWNCVRSDGLNDGAAFPYGSGNVAWARAGTDIESGVTLAAVTPNTLLQIDDVDIINNKAFKWFYTITTNDLTGWTVSGEILANYQGLADTEANRYLAIPTWAIYGLTGEVNNMPHIITCSIDAINAKFILSIENTHATRGFTVQLLRTKISH